MTAALLFAFYAGAAGWLAPVALRGRWAARAPRLAISLWLVSAVSWVIAVIMAVLGAAAPFPLAWPAPGPAAGRVRAGPAVPGGQMLAAAGLAAAAAVVVRAGWCLARQMHGGRRAGREHAALVAAAGRPGPERDVVIVDHDGPAVYCLTCGRARIVVSAGALAALTPEQIRVVLAHERAHLRGRHHAMLTLAAGLARAFPGVPLLAQAQRQLGILAEMAADDAAARGRRAGDLAAALVILAGAGPGPAVLTAGGPAAVARLERLLTQPGRSRARAAALAAVAGLLPPAAVACVPVLIAACDLVTHPR